jgi:RNA polymerase sigma-70 factor (ECF subfamily)
MDHDEDLLQAWRAGDRRAGARFVECHFARLYRFFATKVESPATAEDLAQQTLMACLESDDPQLRSSVRAYLLGIGRNLLLKHYRKRHRHDKAVRLMDLSVEQITGNLSTKLDRKHRVQDMLQGLRQLPLDLQTVVELFYWETFSLEEIGVALEIPVGTVKSKLHRAKQRLRQHLDRPTGPPDLQTWMRVARASMEPAATGGDSED